MDSQKAYKELRHFVLNTGRLMGRSGFDVAGWMQQHGQGGTVNDVEDEAHAGTLSGFVDFKRQQCYNNAAIAMYVCRCPQGGKLRYVEGWVFHPMGLPVQHAWNVDDEGNLYDFTATLFWGDFQPAAWYGFEVPEDVMDEYQELDEDRMLMQTALFYYMQKTADNEAD